MIAGGMRAASIDGVETMVLRRPRTSTVATRAHSGSARPTRSSADWSMRRNWPTRNLGVNC